MTQPDTTDRILIVSFHDLSPHSRERCRDFLADMREIGVERVSLLVVPCWHGDKAFTEDTAFVEWLRSLAEAGHELSLHGYTHQAETVTGGPVARAMGRIYTASEGEFYQISRSSAKERLSKGIGMFREAGLPMEGFTPPAWLLSDEGREALRESGMLYTTSLQNVEILAPDRRIYAPTLVFSSRNLWRRIVSLGGVRVWSFINRKTPVLRLAVHPADLDYPSIRATIVQLARHALKTRTPVTYRDLAHRFD